MVYIQSNNEITLPHHFDASCAMYGAIDSGLEFRLTSFEEVQSGKFDALIRKNLFVGSVEFMREIFSHIGLADVRLPMNSDRSFEAITLGEAKQRALSGKKLFIKPFEIKLFTGFVLDESIYSSIKNLPDDTKVMAYKPFEEKIISEWRLYINNGKIVDARNYAGEFESTPDYMHWKKILTFNYKNFPCAYTIDIGILCQSLDNVMIEFNDMWAIGNYGVPNDIYLRLLKDRYFEIIKTI